MRVTSGNPLGGPSVRPLTHARSRFRAVGKSHDASYFPPFDAKGTGPSDVDRFLRMTGCTCNHSHRKKIYVFIDLKGYYLKATLFKSGDEFRSQLRVHVISFLLTIRPSGFFLEEANFALSYTCLSRRLELLIEAIPGCSAEERRVAGTLRPEEAGGSYMFR